MRATATQISCLLFALTACSADKGSDTSSTSDTSDTSDSSATITHYTLSGTAIAFGAARLPASEGACVTVLDPQGGIEGGTPQTLGTTTVGADGSFSVADIPAYEQPPLILIDDCGAQPPQLFPTGTPVQPELLAGVTDGDTVDGVIAVSLDVDHLDSLTSALTAAGSTANVTTDGMMFGFIWSTTDQSPIPNAQIQCTGCTVYYGDADDSDGLFSTAGVLNTATSDLSFFVSPAAPITTYTVSASGYTFDTVTVGAIPKGAMFAILGGTPG